MDAGLQAKAERAKAEAIALEQQAADARAMIDAAKAAKEVPAPITLAQGSGLRVQGPGFRVQGSGFRVRGVGFRVYGLGCRV